MAKRRRVSKASKRRLMFFGLISLAVIIYFFVSLGSYTYKIINLNNEKKKLETELNEKKESEEDLTNEIERLKDPDYLARYARENFSYSKDGEYIIKISEDEKQNRKINENLYRDYIIYTGTGIIALILIYILKKGSVKKKKQSNNRKR